MSYIRYEEEKESYCQDDTLGSGLYKSKYIHCNKKSTEEYLFCIRRGKLLF